MIETHDLGGGWAASISDATSLSPSFFDAESTSPLFSPSVKGPSSLTAKHHPCSVAVKRAVNKTLGTLLLGSRGHSIDTKGTDDEEAADVQIRVPSPLVCATQADIHIKSVAIANIDSESANREQEQVQVQAGSRKAGFDYQQRFAVLQQRMQTIADEAEALGKAASDHLVVPSLEGNQPIGLESGIGNSSSIVAPETYEVSAISTSIESLSLHDLINEKAKLKKSLSKFESEFEESRGYAPKKADKEQLKPLYTRYKIAKRCIASKVEELKTTEVAEVTEAQKSDVHPMVPDGQQDRLIFPIIPLDNPVPHINRWLAEERRKSDRAQHTLMMSTSELIEEKRVMKSVLVEFDRQYETVKGCAPTRADKVQLKPLYALYKSVKHKIGSAESGKTDTISLDATSLFHSSSAARSTSPLGPANIREESSLTVSMVKKSQLSSTASQAQENHRQGPTALTNTIDLGLIQELRREKKELQKALHIFEAEFAKTYGHAPKTRRDREPKAAQFRRYKELKQKLHEMTTLSNTVAI